MPSFFTEGICPDLTGYYQHQWQYELRFLIPYCIASVILTFVCLFVAPKLSNRLTGCPNVVVYSTASLVLMFAAAAASDVVKIMWVKDGVFYGSTFHSYPRLLIVSFPLAVISTASDAIEKQASSRA